MEKKYRIVETDERKPTAFDQYYTNLGLLDFNDKDGEFWDDTDSFELYPNWWLEEIEDREEELLQWKESALKVMNNIDLQKVGKLLGVPIGADISSQILPSIEMLIKENEQLKKMVSN